MLGLFLTRHGLDHGGEPDLKSRIKPRAYEPRLEPAKLRPPQLRLSFFTIRVAHYTSIDGESRVAVNCLHSRMVHLQFTYTLHS
jgi:hypothetical protein